MKFNFDSFPILKTERLTLRKLTFDDLDTIFKLRTNKEVNKFIIRNIPKNISDAKDFIQMILNLVAKNEAIFWVISLKETNQLIGTIGLRNFDCEPNYAEIGYELHPNFQQKGFMSEAIVSVLNFGFRDLQLNTIEAFTHKNNIASIALLKKHQFIFQPERKDEGFENNRIFRLENNQ